MLKCRDIGRFSKLASPGSQLERPTTNTSTPVFSGSCAAWAIHRSAPRRCSQLLCSRSILATSRCSFVLTGGTWIKSAQSAREALPLRAVAPSRPAARLPIPSSGSSLSRALWHDAIRQQMQNLAHAALPVGIELAGLCDGCLEQIGASAAQRGIRG